MNYRRLYISGGTYFFTLVTSEREPIFTDPGAATFLQDCVEVIQQKHPFTLVAYALLPDHVHMLWTLPPGDNDFSTRWRQIKTRFTRHYRRLRKISQEVWQDRFWEHYIRDERDFEKHFDYIHFNPVKHGLVKCAADWPHSSFQHFVHRGIYQPDWYTLEDLDRSTTGE